MNLEFIRYPNEADDDFAHRIKRSSKSLGLKILWSTAKVPENTMAGVNLRKITTDNGIIYRYETDEER